jgi:hypothetical protein
VESGIDHVGDPISARDPQRVLLEDADRNRQIVGDDDGVVVRRSAPDRPLGIVEPSADRERKRSEPFPPHIDRIFSWKAKARHGVP